ncbi:hypothetical protein GCM10009547_48890 [Sporichthya brevicatena]|uniref:Uncharacterized protein n=1 Tax=Sporichthya brevicatena TaxID=171442 RepID=A0ABP3SHI8_9ACTN
MSRVCSVDTAPGGVRAYEQGGYLAGGDMAGGDMVGGEMANLSADVGGSELGSEDCQVQDLVPGPGPRVRDLLEA